MHKKCFFPQSEQSIKDYSLTCSVIPGIWLSFSVLSSYLHQIHDIEPHVSYRLHVQYRYQMVGITNLYLISIMFKIDDNELIKP